ncbi:GtrA family protein [Paenibacillus senegalensis]|uniref:GtrA family protein n=1 Tax=Paenibacillus senegalensis TaxID=1465766 RepID=UPI000289E4E3|nr:GtrA family protein [Paenibacillus senegalensis]
MKNRFSRTGMIQLIKFNMVGVLNTLVDFLIYTLLFSLGMHYMIAQVAAYAGGMTNSYLFNRYWTFGSAGAAAGGIATMARFAAVNGVTLGLSLLLLYLLGERAGMHPLMAKVLVVGATMVINFVGTKFWVFRQRPDRN